ncbi:MAG TPA: sodium:calcium exchanger, partial [Planctomycetaceae bacterium]|nr:sodium:calcium exchanger [Planctomycetaceae bacterium]
TDSDITELDETFLVNLSSPQSDAFQPTLADSQAVVTIQDDDPTLLSINDISVDENAGIALVTVSLDQAALREFSVDYSTADGTASSGSDYQFSTGTLTFNPGDTTQTIEIPLIDSTLGEADETFLVNLLNLQAAGLDVNLTDSQGEVTIRDDDRSSLSVQDLSVDENAGTVLLTVSLDQPLLTSITVDFEM